MPFETFIALHCVVPAVEHRAKCNQSLQQVPEKERTPELKKVSTSDHISTHTKTSVENYRPASGYASQYLAYGVTEGNVPSL